MPAQQNEGGFLYYGLLLYTFIFYTQIAGRIPALKPLRLEFVLGAIILIGCIIKIVNGEIKLGDNKLNIIAIAFIVVFFLTVPFAMVKIRAYHRCIQIFKFFSIYLMIVAAIDTEKKLRVFLFIYLCMVAFIFTEPFILSLQGKGFIYNNHMMRLAGVTGYFAHPNDLGMITSSHLPFFFYFAFQKKLSLKYRIACLLLIPIGLRVIMLTQSRTAFLGVLTFMGLLWVFSKKRIFIAIVMMVAFGTVWLFTPESTKTRFLTLKEAGRVIESGREGFNDEENKRLGSMASRWELMHHALIVFAEHPILGVGVDCFSSYSGRRWGSWFPPHNTYLQALSETGIIGFTIFFLVIFFTFQNIRKIRNISKIFEGKDSFFLSAGSAVMVFYIIFVVVAFFGIEYYSNAWWIAGGLSVVMLDIFGRKHQVEIKPEV